MTAGEFIEVTGARENNLQNVVGARARQRRRRDRLRSGTDPALRRYVAAAAHAAALADR